MVEVNSGRYSNNLASLRLVDDAPEKQSVLRQILPTQIKLGKTHVLRCYWRKPGAW